MKPTMNLEEHRVMKEKREKNMKSKNKSKFTENDDMSLLLQKKIKAKKEMKNKESQFRNNYKNYQYDYEEDLYEPKY